MRKLATPPAPTSSDGPDDVSKAARSVNAGGTALVQSIASSLQTPAIPAGTGTPASGPHPNPGVLPPETEGFGEPVQFQFPWGTNQIYTPRQGFGTPFDQMRNLASMVPEVQMCIQCRKDQMVALKWDFAVKDKKRDTQDAADINRARAFFAKPDGVTPFNTWVQMLVDEVLVIDALSIFKRRTRGKTAGRITGTDMYGYEIIDGSTIKPLLDMSGRSPLPPSKAYRQIIYGSPMTGADFTSEELIYRPRNVRTWTPYGMSPLESLMLVVTGALNRSLYNLSYYREGNIPEALAGVPDTWQPKDIKNFNAYWNMLMVNDPSNRSKMRFVPQSIAKSVHEFRTADFSTAWELWLLKVTCACFGVTPSEIGFTDDVNKATSKTQGDVNQRRGVKPMAGFIKGLFDMILATDLGLPHLEAVFSGGEGEDALSQERIMDLRLRNGRVQLDELRSEDGNAPLGLPPGMITATGYTPFETPATGTATGGKKVIPEGTAAAVGGDSAQTGNAEEAAATAATAMAEKADLERYKAVALKAVKAHKRVPAFQSAVIQPERLHQVAKALSQVKTLEQVRAVFRSVAKAQTLSPNQAAEMRSLQRELEAVLSAEGGALVSHLEPALVASSA